MENENMSAVGLPKKNTPRDVFLHLLAIVTLFWSAISFVTLVWQFIDKWFPDILNYSYYGADSFSTWAIRFSVSTLIIVFPVFIAVSWFLNKIYRKEAQVRESKIRKWLIYLTLFIASLVIIIDLVTTINTFLGGGVTTSFIFKALSIIVVSGIIFGYYLDDVRREEPAKSAKYFAWVSAILVLVAIVWAFVIVGSPDSARMIQYDQQRISDLQSIQSEVVSYWQKKGTMPNSLSDLNDAISGFMMPTDPATKVSYEYNVIDSKNLDFSLCATFSSPTPSGQQSNFLSEGANQNYWYHGAGHVCFSRIIDKQLYPQITPAPVTKAIPVQ